mmetsp:Transcript_3707/g.9421  ORF Transcript_3707/g.9421 Transcript_3707/m.9421 type:complete len:399 (+) Transcript_3707:1329-2525(+)
MVQEPIVALRERVAPRPWEVRGDAAPSPVPLSQEVLLGNVRVGDVLPQRERAQIVQDGPSQHLLLEVGLGPTLGGKHLGGMVQLELRAAVRGDPDHAVALEVGKVGHGYAHGQECHGLDGPDLLHVEVGPCVEQRLWVVHELVEGHVGPGGRGQRGVVSRWLLLCCAATAAGLGVVRFAFGSGRFLGWSIRLCGIRFRRNLRQIFAAVFWFGCLFRLVPGSSSSNGWDGWDNNSVFACCCVVGLLGRSLLRGRALLFDVFRFNDGLAEVVIVRSVAVGIGSSIRRVDSFVFYVLLFDFGDGRSFRWWITLFPLVHSLVIVFWSIVVGGTMRSGTSSLDGLLVLFFGGGAVASIIFVVTVALVAIAVAVISWFGAVAVGAGGCDGDGNGCHIRQYRHPK